MKYLNIKMQKERKGKERKDAKTGCGPAMPRPPLINLTVYFGCGFGIGFAPLLSSYPPPH